MHSHIHGAKWWKFDFHNHTPASADYGKGPDQAILKNITPKEWLLNYMQAGIDCIAVTDHNTGGWINQLKEALTELDTEKPEGYKKIYLFPGVEITANNNVHILAIFNLDASTETITSLLGSVGFPTQSFGTSDAVTRDTVEQVIVKILEAGGIPIPAHVDKPSGLFENLSVGHTLGQILEKHNLLAIEIIDRTYNKPDIYRQLKLSLAEIVGTDSHFPAQIGTNFTWVKMQEPSLDALRLALHDGEDGVIRKDQGVDNPNSILNRFFIKRITIKSAYKAGNGTPLEVNFSPWLSSIIGGRGSGKSTIVNFLRIVLNKGSELPNKIKEEFDKFYSIGDKTKPGMLRSNTSIAIEIIKDNNHYKLTWENIDGLFHLEHYELATQSWVSQGTITNISDLFPVQLFSQKELYELTQNPNKLLELIDSQFDKKAWVQGFEILENEWIEFRRKMRLINQDISQEQNILAEQLNVKAKIKVYEDSGNKETLSNFSKANLIKSNIDGHIKDISDFNNRLSDIKNFFPLFKLLPDILSELDEESKDKVEQFSRGLEQAKANFLVVVEQLNNIQNDIQVNNSNFLWEVNYETAKAQYEALTDQLKSLGPETYEVLLKKRDELDEKISRIEASKTQLSELKERHKEKYNEIIDHYKNLHVKRKSIIDIWSNHPGAANLSLSIELDLMGDIQKAEESFRSLIRKSGIEFERFILKEGEADDDNSGIVYEISSSQASNRWTQRSTSLNKFIKATEAEPNGLDKRLVKHIEFLRSNTPEDIDRLLIWVPEDKIILKFNKNGSTQDIQTGSAGERTAGMLALLMALNHCPLIIDQPEDDLDTRLISNFVVESFKELKKNRQLIIVTHNPNITVNATSEKIIEMNYIAGQIFVKSAGALQMTEIRKAVCDVMEGGEIALNKRYFRISKALN